MTGLKIYTKHHRRLAAASVLGVTPATLFHLSWARNAWNYTWSTDREERFIHQSLTAAQTRAEDLRKRGSSFLIEELPAILIRSNLGIVALTEYDAAHPLKRCASYLDRKDTIHYWMCKDRHTVGALVDCCIAAASCNKSGASRGALVIVTHRKPDLVLPPLRKRSLREWRSLPVGSERLLDWIESGSGYRSGPARILAEKLLPPHLNETAIPEAA